MHAWPIMRSAGMCAFFVTALLAAVLGMAARARAVGMAGVPTGDAARTSSAVRLLAASCAACHGTDGRAVRVSVMAALAGMPKDQFLAQMRAFRSGERASTIMRQIAAGYDEGQLEALAAYFAALAPGRDP